LDSADDSRIKIKQMKANVQFLSNFNTLHNSTSKRQVSRGPTTTINMRASLPHETNVQLAPNIGKKRIHNL